MSCSSTDSFSGFSYDPEGATETSDKEIDPPQRRIISYPEDSLSFLATFDAARLGSVLRDSAYSYQLTITPENGPINNSPWYAFGIDGPTDTSISITLSYQDADHRYIPKRSYDRNDWVAIDSSQWQVDTLNGTLSLDIVLNDSPIWIAAQEIITSEHSYQELHTWATKHNGKIDTIGYSAQGRPLLSGYFPATQLNSRSEQPTLVLMGRQHPPELTGALGLRNVAEVLLSSDPKAKNFRQQYALLIIPVINPDGVDGGHWRHNANGVDLNRDWQAFNQPETQAVREALLTLEKSGHDIIYAIDFHSTDEHILYPILREYDVPPHNLTYRWADRIQDEMPNLELAVEPFDLTAPIAKNWVVRTFDSEAVTFELDDEADRTEITRFSRTAASTLIDLLLDHVTTEPINADTK